VRPAFITHHYLPLKGGDELPLPWTVAVHVVQGHPQYIRKGVPGFWPNDRERGETSFQVRMGLRRTSRWWRSCTYAALPGDRGHGFGRYYWRTLGELLQSIWEMRYCYNRGEGNGSGEWLQAVCFVLRLLSLLHVIGATLIWARDGYSITFLACVFLIVNRFWGIRKSYLLHNSQPLISCCHNIYIACPVQFCLNANLGIFSVMEIRENVMRRWLDYLLLVMLIVWQLGCVNVTSHLSVRARI